MTEVLTCQPSNEYKIHHKRIYYREFEDRRYTYFNRQYLIPSKSLIIRDEKTVDYYRERKFGNVILIIMKLVSFYFEFLQELFYVLKRYITHSKDCFFQAPKSWLKKRLLTPFSVSGNLMKHLPLCFIFYENVWPKVPNSVWKRFVSLIHE